LVKRGYKYRFYPTPEQAQELERTFGTVRYVYNRTLAERTRAYSQETRRVNYAESARWLAQWRADPETAWLAESASVPQQQAVRQLQTAFNNFFAKRAKYPRFKRKGRSRDSATYTRFGFSYRDGQVKLAKMSEPLNIRWSRALPPGEPTRATVTRDPSGRYFISLLMEEEVFAPAPTRGALGLDAGLNRLLTDSEGREYTNPKHEQRERKRLAKAQRALAHKKKGSRNREKARLRVARIHARIADRRRDYLHKLTTSLIRENQTVMIEDLAVRNMVRNHSMARAISDASWSELRSMLEYKAQWYEREVVAIDRFYPSSKTCSSCGHLLNALPLDIRQWSCPECGASHDRDVNAARNILAVGLTVSACGDGVRLLSA
jgi:putative transposase